MLHQVGTGVLGPVYRARESDGDRPVAIKSFELDLTPEQVEIFGNALAHIVNVEVSHPAIVAPLAAGLESGTPFMAYEYVAGESLDVVLRRDARPAAALEWLALLAGAVDAAHARGLEHGALHLRDVLVSADGVCATGFGIARALEHVQLGSPVRRPYAAPELMAGRRWGPPADRFAVAALAYELLTGVRPSGNGDGVVADLPDLRPDAADPAGLQQAFRNALADEPSIRSASATAFVTAVARAIGDEASDGSPVPRGGDPMVDGAPDSLQETVAAPRGAGLLDMSLEPGELPFAAPPSEAPAGRVRAGSGDTPGDPAHVSRPDPAAGLEDRSAGSEGADNDGREVRGERAPRSQRTSRPKRRPSRRSGARRRTGPVVAVRDDVHFDPLDDPSSVEPTFKPSGYDEDVPPPPTPTSMRAMAPVVAAMAVGVLMAYLVYTGLGTPGDEAAGSASEPREASGMGVEWSEATVSPPAVPRPPETAGEPLTLFEEPIVQVGDPPAPGADPLSRTDLPPPDPPAAVADPPVASLPPSTVVPPTAAEAPPVSSGRVSVRTTPPGALVTLDGSARGAAPVSIEDVSTGVHRLRVTAPGHVPAERDITVSSGAPTTTVNIALTPLAALNAPARGATEAMRAGSLQVLSRPAGATVSVDDVVVGVTPLDVGDVTLGTRQVRIELPGYRPWVTEVDVSGSEQVRVGASLEPEAR